MRKFFIVVSFLFTVLVMTACFGKKYEIALITDIGQIDDKSFNQGAWEGVKKYADEHNKSYKYYKPLAKSTKDYVDAIDLAVKGGAKVIVTPGYLFEPAVYEAQDKYPNVTFILLDGSPNNIVYNDDGTTSGERRIEDNVYSIFYAEQQSGFLAGYAAVKNGFTELGFMGGMAVPAVVRFGYGYLQGAEYAAREMNLSDGAIQINYTYLGEFGPKPEFQTKAASWYNDGIEVIFAAAGGAGGSVMAASVTTANKYVIGVDVDQSGEKETVITSAKKELANSVYQCLTAYYDNNNAFFKKGESVTMDVTNDGVGLPTDFSRFPGHVFTATVYNSIYTSLKNNTNNIRTNIKDDSTSWSDLIAGFTKVTVTNDSIS